MRAVTSQYSVVVPMTLAEALKLYHDEPTLAPLAGGTDLMVLFEAGSLREKRLLSLHRLRELGEITTTPDWVKIGALVTYSDLCASQVIATEFPNLFDAARQTGSIAIQNRGTLGGNIANASPAADSPPALLTYDAILDLASVKGERSLPYQGFHTAYKKTLRAAGELITAIRLPRCKKVQRHYYCKVGTRRAQAISKVVFAATYTKDANSISNVRLAVGSVAPIPLRCRQTEALLEGRPVSHELLAAAKAALHKEITPINDIRSTADFRRVVAANLLQEFLTGAMQ